MLLPVLEANTAHLSSWVPAPVIAPVPPAALASRLGGFAADFAAGRSGRFAIFLRQRNELLGEVSLFYRNATGRVDRAAADRLEIGYWLRHDATGRGYATEAARALLALAGKLEGLRQVEIRCDPRNAPSAAVPARLGFQLIETETDTEGEMVWIRGLGTGDG